MGEIILILLLLGLILILLCLILYFLYKWLVKKGYRWIANTVILSLVAIFFYNIYIAVYPADSFYFDDFKTVTSREIPKSAFVIDKSASYPDFHGHYISCSLIRLSKQDYINLLNELKNDKSMYKNAEITYSDEFNEVMQNKNAKNIKSVFARSNDGKPDDCSYIGFFDDEKTIVVWFFKT
jgi:hypothetical protein